ncbi:MAG: hypothetical protein HRU19_30260 [Pseudobacteriovorax sp.]|nr:hypothetical protein [Pseudobacteriovorax sp.]
MMNGADLGSQLKAAVDGISDKSDHARLWNAVGNAIVKHITENAEVTAGILVSTTGTASAQTGQTTSTGKIQ